MQFSDIYLNADEFFEILRYAWEKSEFFDGWDKRQHPEDLAVNIEVVLDSVTCGMVYYSHIISNNSRKSMQPPPPPYNPNKKTVEDMKIQKEQSNAKWTAYNAMEYANLENKPAVYPDVFGDNV